VVMPLWNEAGRLGTPVFSRGATVVYRIASRPAG
jgi:hypothetical protein